MKLGEGAYSRVVIDDRYPRNAIKEMSVADLNCAVKEIALMRTFDHVNVVKAERVELTDKCCRIWMPRYAGSLGDTLRGIDERPVGMTGFLRIVAGVAAGVNHIHAKRVIHCDIKPDNILLQHDMTPAVCDFNISRVNIGRRRFNGAVQSLPYRAPDVKFGCPHTYYTEQIDIWSVGCVFLELLTGKLLVQAGDADDTSVSVCRWLHGELFDTRDKRIDSIEPATYEQVWVRIRDMFDADVFRRVIVHAKYKKTVVEHMMSIIAGCLMPNARKRLSSQQLLNQTLDLIAACTEVDAIGVLPERSTRDIRRVLRRSRKRVHDSVPIESSEAASFLDGYDSVTRFVASNMVNKCVSVYRLKPPPLSSTTGYVSPAMTPRNIGYACVYIAACVFDERPPKHERITFSDTIWLCDRVLSDLGYRVLSYAPKLREN